jgi:hypothetical protein
MVLQHPRRSFDLLEKLTSILFELFIGSRVRWGIQLK